MLKFVTQSDLVSLDPTWTTGYGGRNHAYMVYDTLYGQFGPKTGFKAAPQMVAGHTIDDSGRTWKLSLREGLVFHDGDRVLARDCVASVKRWALRDSFGQALMQRVDSVTAPDDNTLVFRLKKPFPLLPDALGKWGGYMCAIMPERLASTDPFTQIKETIGSGPFRFRADERTQGSMLVYERFADYRPREGGEPEWTSGPKTVHFDRVEWHVISDPATAAVALQKGEMDWLEYTTPDLVPALVRNGLVKIGINDPTGLCGILRPNHLWPPFDNPEIRRALLGAIDQAAFMIAVAGTDTSYWRDKVGFFAPSSPMASDAGMTALAGKHDPVKVRQQLQAAGYEGEEVVLLVPTNVPELKALTDVAFDMLKRVGINMDYQSLDMGTVSRRELKKDRPTRGGWNAVVTSTGGSRIFSPAAHDWIRGTGEQGFFGWPSSSRIEALRNEWFDAPDVASQKQLTDAIQDQAFRDLPYYPLGLYYAPMAYRADLTGILDGLPLFWNVQRS